MNIFGMGPMELLLIVVLALIVFGPAKLPEIMGQVGKAINDFRRATNELSEEFNRTIQTELQEGKSVLTETKSAITDVHTTVNTAMLGSPTPALVAAPGQSVSATNGTVPETHIETATNGSLPSPSKQPLADTTTQWTWEVAGPPASATDPTAPGGTPKSNETEPPIGSDQQQTARERPHDELLPPY